MNKDEYWEHFISTGSVEDYLLYAGCIDKEGKEQEKSGKDKDHAGERSDNGDYTTDRAYRGIR